MLRNWKRALLAIALALWAGSGQAQAQPQVPANKPAAAPEPIAAPEPLAPVASASAPIVMPAEDPSKSLQLSVGERVWASCGQSTWSLAGPSFLTGLPVSPVSDLKWRNLHSTVFETNIDGVLNNFFVSRVCIGAGGIGGGHMDDLDYNGDNRTNLGSQSRSTVANDGLFYVNADFGLRVLSRGDENGSCKPKLTVDALVGYQLWREKYVGSDTLQTFAAPPFSNLIQAGTLTRGETINEVWERNSIRVGFRGNYDLGDRFSVNSQVMFVPWADNSMVDHHLPNSPATRTYRSNGDGGFGVMWDATASYRIWKGLSAELGYQMWYQNVSNGSISLQGVENAYQIKELSTFRHGLLAGVKWSF